MARAEHVDFEGVRFRRYPDSANRSDRVYFKSHGWTGKPKYLHVAVYEHHNGPVDGRHVVHHKDGNPLNNAPANLEAIPTGDHVRLHAAELAKDPEHVARQRELLARIRPLAAEWHRSDEGREWHRQHGRETWAAREPERHTCEQCGANFETLKRGGVRFCSNRCKAAHRYASGVDNEQRECKWCGDAFTVNRYYKTLCCSNTCAQRHRRRGERRIQHHG